MTGNYSVGFGTSPHPPAFATIDLSSAERRLTMSKMPPVPPEQRSPKGPGSDPKVEIEEKAPDCENYDEQGTHANVRQNTIHQGTRQSR
jgi:hypothetical protein